MEVSETPPPSHKIIKHFKCKYRGGFHRFSVYYIEIFGLNGWIFFSR